MTEAIQKLIAENRWQATASYDDTTTHQAINYGGDYLVKQSDGKVFVAFIVFNCTRHQWGVYSREYAEAAQPFTEFTHFRPLPDNRLADVCAVLLDRLDKIHSWCQGNIATGDVASGFAVEVRDSIEQAISRANEIAGGRE